MAAMQRTEIQYLRRCHCLTLFHLLLLLLLLLKEKIQRFLKL
jgi:hypothetical protein